MGAVQFRDWAANRLLRRGLRGVRSRARGVGRREAGSGSRDAGLRDGCSVRGDALAVQGGRDGSIHVSITSQINVKERRGHTRVPNRMYANDVSLLCTSSLSTPNTIALLIRLASG